MDTTKKWRGKFFKLTKKNEWEKEISYVESLNPKDDKTPIILLTIGEGAEHEHMSMSFDEAKELKDFLETFIKYYN